MQRYLVLFFSTLVLWAVGTAGAKAAAQDAESANNGTVGVIAGTLGNSGARLVSELASVLDEGDQLRVVPIIGKGSLRNLGDMLYLKGIDLSIVPTDVLEEARQQSLHPHLTSLIHYVSTLYYEELHVLAGESAASLADLAGKKVNFISDSDGTFVTGRALFDALGIVVEPVFLDLPLAIEKVMRGEIAATLLVTAKPAADFASLTGEDGLHLLSVTASDSLPDTYLPAVMTAADYPGLIAADEGIETIAVRTALVAYNWKQDTWRYSKVSRFVDAFLARIGELQQRPRHEKWQEVNIRLDLPGWQRFKPAREWLQENALVAKADKGKKSLRRQFELFLTEVTANQGKELTDLGEVSKEELFNQFLEWQRRN